MKTKLVDAAWVAELVAALEDGQDALKQAKNVARNPARPRIERAELAVQRARAVLAKGATFTVECADNSTTNGQDVRRPVGDEDEEPNWMGW